jgi:hypothetical protein
MPDPTVVERIAAWQAAGLIDEETAARLQVDEAARPTPTPLAAIAPTVVPARESVTAPRPGGALSTFGPVPTVAEVLGYVGGAFLLAAWFVLVSTRAQFGLEGPITWSIAFGGAALATGGLAVLLRGRDERGSRAAGVLFATAVACTFGLGFELTDAVGGTETAEQTLFAGLAATIAAVVVRARHAALLTQAALLGAVTSLALGFGQYAKDRLLPPGLAPDTLAGMALDLGLWLVTAFVLGLVGLREALAGGGDPGARRAALSRFAAGLTAVVATASILTRSGPLGGTDPYGNLDWGRLLEPVLADAAIGFVALVLLWLAFRRGTVAYLYPAALGIVIALTDLNGSYVVGQVGTGVALLLEGLVILGAGLAADRLRRRLRLT